MIAHTSVEAYHSLDRATYIQPKEQRVVDALVRHGDLSRQQVSQVTGIPLHCVCGRVHSLIEARVLEERGTRTDPSTHKPQKLLHVVKEA